MKTLIDCTDTSHSRQHSGIPQVVRNLYASWPDPSARRAIVLDKYSRRWRRADRRELRWLDPEHHILDDAPARLRNWSDWQKVRGRLARHFPAGRSVFGAETGLLAPELFYPAKGHRFDKVRSAGGGPLTAIFHDAVALRFPEYSPPAIVENFNDYLDCLAGFDAVASVSEASRTELLAYWENCGVADPPPVSVIPLGTGLCAMKETTPAAADALPLILFVSTIEPRKNHNAVLVVAEELWTAGLRFRLEFAGGCNAEVREEWRKRLESVRAPDGCFRYHGRVSRDKLHSLYREACFTVYPSFWEGFGLPVLESLSFGKPCICSDRGGLAEIASGGGCIVVNPERPEELASAWRRLLADAGLYGRMVEAAQGRTFRTWRDYAIDVRDWLEGVKRRT